MRILYILALLVILAGCGGDTMTQELIQDDRPLTIEEWKQLDVMVKYELETFDRIKQGMPKLKNDKIWDKFMRQVVIPERQKDIPTDYNHG